MTTAAAGSRRDPMLVALAAEIVSLLNFALS
jgi:hypothetical protein